MARKVFISVLGTGFYDKTSYLFPDSDHKSSETRFIQAATLEYLKVSEWTKVDKILILLTVSATEKNWDKRIVTREDTKKRKNPKVYDPDAVVEYIRLEQVLDDMHLACSIKTLPIRDGNNKEEMFEIFKKLYDELLDGDELYFDMTHGFRYLPMLALVLGNYAKFLKGVKVMHMSYGNMFTKPNTIQDILPLSEIQDWTDAVEHLTYSGNVEKLNLLYLQEKELHKGFNPMLKALEQSVKPLHELTSNLKTCQGRLIIEAKDTKKLKGNLEKGLKELLPKPVQPVIEKVEKMFASFSTNKDWKNSFHAARWCFEHQQYQQSITFIQEGAITGLTKFLGLNEEEKDDRTFVSGTICRNVTLIMTRDKKIHPDALRFINGKHDWNLKVKSMVEYIFANPILMSLYNILNKTTSARNQYNHGGMLNDSNRKHDGIIKENKEILLLTDEICHLEEPTPFVFSNPYEPLFINLSNHDYSTWSQAQLDAARQYGELKYIRFPEVDPDKDERGLQADVANILKDIDAQTHGNTESIIHVMGEMTLTYRLVKKLKEMGYTCVASTTKRNSVENPDGSKTSVFEFSKFRRY